MKILQFFTYEHLPVNLQVVSKPFGDTAKKLASMTDEQLGEQRHLRYHHQAANVFSVLCWFIDNNTPPNEEATCAVVKIGEAGDMFDGGAPMKDVLRRLLEAKDCAVRALLFKHDT